MTTTTHPILGEHADRLTSEQAARLVRDHDRLTTYGTPESEWLRLLPLLVQETLDDARDQEAYAHLPPPSWAEGLRADMWQVETDGIARRYWTVQSWPEVTGTDDDRTSANVIVTGVQEDTGAATLGVQVFTSGDPVLSIGDALKLGRALIAAAGRVQGLGSATAHGAEVRA